MILDEQYGRGAASLRYTAIHGPPHYFAVRSARTSAELERMLQGEFAVLYSSHWRDPDDTSNESQAGPVCTLFPSLLAAEEHARQQVVDHPALRCRIYGVDGLGSQPVEEVRGKEYRGESEISARFRRWGGSILFVGGVALTGWDALHGFSLSWPATIGVRAFPVGLILLLTEVVLIWEARRNKRLIQ